MLQIMCNNTDTDTEFLTQETTVEHFIQLPRNICVLSLCLGFKDKYKLTWFTSCPSQPQPSVGVVAKVFLP